MSASSLLVKGAIALAVVGGLAGCNDNDEIQQQDTIKNDAVNRTVTSFNQENKELSDMLKQMKERDPSISSLYYSFDDQGQKQLHIVRDDSVANGDAVSNIDFNDTDKQVNAQDLDQLYSRLDQDTQQANPVPSYSGGTTTHRAESDHSYSDYVFPMVAGLTTGMLLSNFMNGGMKNMVNTYHPKSYSNLDNEERKKRHNAGASSYLYRSLNNNRNVSKTNYSNGSLKSPALSTRTNGFFSSKGSSARSSGYSGGS